MHNFLLMEINFAIVSFDFFGASSDRCYHTSDFLAPMDNFLLMDINF